MKTFDSPVSSSYMLLYDDCLDLISYFFNLDDLKGKEILDAGCRLGEYANVFYNIGAKPTGIDISFACIEKARQQYPYLKDRFFQMDICDLSEFKSNTFDLVFCVGTMPYLSQEQFCKALAELKRVSKPDGSIFLVFQKDKSMIIKAITKLINIIPMHVYELICVPIFSFLFRPISKMLLKRTVTLDYIKYGVFLSLRGIHYGYPSTLAPFKIKGPDSSIVTNTMNDFFIIKGN